MPDNLTPSNVAKKVGKSTTTIRRMTRDYADYLSDKATPSPGGQRRYTPDDVETLSLIVTMRDDGRPDDEIIRFLEAGILPAKVSTSPASPPTQPPAQFVDVGALTQAIERQAASQAATLAALERVATAQEEDARAVDRHTIALERFATAITAFGAALLIIALITLAVAAGWIG